LNEKGTSLRRAFFVSQAHLFHPAARACSPARATIFFAPIVSKPFLFMPCLKVRHGNSDYFFPHRFERCLRYVGDRRGFFPKAAAAAVD
jgi:hypothetical protein